MFAKLSPDKLQQGEFARMLWVIVPEPGVPLDTILDPAYWSHVAKRLAPWHRIEVRDPGFQWVAELLVRDCGKNWAKVVLLDVTPFEPRAAAVHIDETADFSVTWRGAARWSVMRTLDGEVMKDGLTTKDEADLWLKHHLTKIAA